MVSFDFIYALVAPYIVSNLTASCFCNEHVFVLITIDKKSEIFSCFNLKKSILVDYSYQYIGLHLADIVAAAFTNALIRQTRGAGFPFAGELYSEIIAKTFVV